MADFLEITYPPFPGSSATVNSIYRCLGELRDWASAQREWANEYVLSVAETPPEGEPFQPLRELPPRVSLDGVSVVDIYRSFRIMRHIREEWDRAIRIFEQDFDDPRFAAWRVRLLGLSYLTLQESFVDAETREALTTQMESESQNMSRKLREVLQRFAQSQGIGLQFEVHGESGESSGESEGSSLSQKDLDRLFYGDEDEPKV